MLVSTGEEKGKVEESWAEMQSASRVRWATPPQVTECFIRVWGKSLCQNDVTCLLNNHSFLLLL